MFHCWLDCPVNLFLLNIYLFFFFSWNDYVIINYELNIIDCIYLFFRLIIVIFSVCRSRMVFGCWHATIYSLSNSSGCFLVETFSRLYIECQFNWYSVRNYFCTDIYLRLKCWSIGDHYSVNSWFLIKRTFNIFKRLGFEIITE